MRIKKGVMTSTDNNSSNVIPFFPYTMEDCIVSTISEKDVREILVNPTDISDSGASVGRVTAIVDNGNGKVIFRPNNECRVVLKMSNKTHPNLVFTTVNSTTKTFNVDITLPLKVSVNNITHVASTGCLFTNASGSVIMSNIGYKLYDNGNEGHIVITGTLNISNITDAVLNEKFVLAVTVDYM